MVEAAYFDSSVLVKLYDLSEKGTREAQKLFRTYRACSSMLLYPEVISALARKERRGELSKKDIQEVLTAFKRDYSRILLVGLSDDVMQQSERLLFTHPLTALDSIHLASAIVLGKQLEQSIPFATADKDLASAAQKEELETFIL